MLRRSQEAFQAEEMVWAVLKVEISVPGINLKLVVDTVSEVRVTGLPHRDFDAIKKQESFSFIETKGGELIFQNSK